eukprot:scaffold8721_cov80-Phaeocystis_antarctica.AAC.34
MALPNRHVHMPVGVCRAVCKHELRERRRSTAADLNPLRLGGRDGSKGPRVRRVAVEILVHGVKVVLVVLFAQAPHRRLGWLLLWCDGTVKAQRLTMLKQLAHKIDRPIGGCRFFVFPGCALPPLARRRLHFVAVLWKSGELIRVNHGLF